MRVKAADKVLVQGLFTLTGAALGAIAVAALVVVLRGWHIWHVPPITATLSSLGGAGIFGAFWLLLWRLGPSNEPTVLSPARRRALLLAMALFIVTAGCLVVSFTTAGDCSLTMGPRLISHRASPASARQTLDPSD